MRKLVLVLLLVALINCQNDGPMKIDVPPDFQRFENKFVLTDRKIEDFVPEALQQQIKQEIEQAKAEIENQTPEQREQLEALINYADEFRNQVEQNTNQLPPFQAQQGEEPQQAEEFQSPEQPPEAPLEQDDSTSEGEQRGRHGRKRHGGKFGRKHGGKDGQWRRNQNNDQPQLDGQELTREVLEHRNRWKQRYEQSSQAVEGSDQLLQGSQPETEPRSPTDENDQRPLPEDEDQDFSSSSESSSEEDPNIQDSQENHYKKDKHSRGKEHMRHFRKKFRKGGFKGPIFILILVGIIVFACKKCRKQRRPSLNDETSAQVPQIVTIPNQNQQVRYVQLTDEQLNALQQQQFRAAQPQQQPVIIGVPLPQQQPRQQVYVPQGFQVQAVPQVNRPHSQNAGIVIEMNPRRYPQLNSEDIPVGQPVNNQYNYPSQ